MSLQIGHLSLVETPVSAAARGASGPDAAPAPRAPEPATADIIPASPPPEVLDEVGAAAERAEQFATRNRELHFAKDPDTGRIVVQVRDLDGNVLRTIPPSEALDLMSGAGDP